MGSEFARNAIPPALSLAAQVAVPPSLEVIPAPRPIQPVAPGVSEQPIRVLHTVDVIVTRSSPHPVPSSAAGKSVTRPEPEDDVGAWTSREDVGLSISGQPVS